MAVGENIKRIRKEKGLTQKKLGELSGINEVQIRSYELGKINPKIETIEKIAKALQCSAGELRRVKTYENFNSEMFIRHPRVKAALIKGLEIMLPEFSPKEFPHDDIESILGAFEKDNEGLADFCNCLLGGIDVEEDEGGELITYYWYDSPADKNAQEGDATMCKRRIQANLAGLNEKGLSKVREYTEDIAKIDEYSKKGVAQSDTKNK